MNNDLSAGHTATASSDLSLDQKIFSKLSNGNFKVLCLLSDLTVDNGMESNLNILDLTWHYPDQTIADTKFEKIYFVFQF